MSSVAFTSAPRTINNRARSRRPLLVAACSDDGGPAVPARISVIAGQQTDTAGAIVGVAPRFRVESADGDAVARATVMLTVTAGGGSAAPEVKTDADGYATVVNWRLGNNVGLNTLHVEAGAAVADIHVTGVAGAAGSCIARVMRRATFPKFQKDRLEISYPFRR